MKATVEYTKLNNKLVVGEPAIIVPVRSSLFYDERPTPTSPIISVGKFGVFETQNTKYRPYKGK